MRHLRSCQIPMEHREAAINRLCEKRKELRKLIHEVDEAIVALVLDYEEDPYDSETTGSESL